MADPKHAQAQRLTARGIFRDLTSFSQLEGRIAALPTAQERGDAFEVFAEAYLATQPIAEVEEVWPEASIPMEVSRQLGLPRHDKGVDGVCKTLDARLQAFQVKFRSGREALNWTEIATFVGLSDRAHTRLLFTNTDTITDVVRERRDFFAIRGNDLDRLTAGELSRIQAWLEGSSAPREHKQPRPHQQNALTGVSDALSTNDRATVLMACGTGKTLVALWAVERMGAHAVLVLIPSLALVRQFVHEWLHEREFPFLCVCSSPRRRAISTFGIGTRKARPHWSIPWMYRRSLDPWPIRSDSVKRLVVS